MNWSKSNKAVFLLIIFYSVGILGLSIPEWQWLFIILTPFNLLLTLGLLFWGNDVFTNEFINISLGIMLFGYLIEVIGVSTGILFGEYWYGEALGFKLLDVPLMIGVNWLILSVGSYSIFQSYISNKIILAIASASLMVILDVIIEPIAVHLDFWQWQGGEIPLQNYIMWLIAAMGIQLVLAYHGPFLKKKIGFTVIGVQFMFFGFLNLILL